MSQKAFDLAAKQEQTILIIIIERFDTEDIPRTKHGFGFLVPDHEGEHAAQFAGQLIAPLLIAMQQHLGIGPGGKGMACSDQFLAQGLEVIDLAVKNADKTAILIEHGLLAALQVNDGKAAVAQGYLVIHIVAFAVRAAVGDQVRHSFYNAAGGFRFMVALSKAGNATHRRFPLSIL